LSVAAIRQILFAIQGGYWSCLDRADRAENMRRPLAY